MKSVIQSFNLSRRDIILKWYETNYKLNAVYKLELVIKNLRSLEKLAPVLFLCGRIRIFIVLTNWKKTGICLTNTNVWSVYFPKIFPSAAATCKHPCSTCGHTSSWMLCLTVRNNHFHNTNKFWHRPSLCKLSDQKTKGIRQWSFPGVPLNLCQSCAPHWR